MLFSPNPICMARQLSSRTFFALMSANPCVDSLKRPGCNAAVTVVHSGVDDLAAIVRTGDVVVAAAGRAGLVTPAMIKPGAAVVGAGTSWEGKRLLSDVDEAVADVAGWITPRLGGVGPMTRAMLLENAVAAAERRR